MRAVVQTIHLPGCSGAQHATSPSKTLLGVCLRKRDGYQHSWGFVQRQRVPTHWGPPKGPQGLAIKVNCKMVGSTGTCRLLGGRSLFFCKNLLVLFLFFPTTSGMDPTHPPSLIRYDKTSSPGTPLRVKNYSRCHKGRFLELFLS